MGCGVGGGGCWWCWVCVRLICGEKVFLNIGLMWCGKFWKSMVLLIGVIFWKKLFFIVFVVFVD